MKKQARVYFTPIPNEVIEDPSLTPTVKSLYILILKFANQNLYCNASQETLSYYLGRSSRQVKSLINVLKSRSLIEVAPPVQFKGTNTYIPLFTIEGKLTSPHTGNIYQSSISGKEGNRLPPNSNIKVKMKNMKNELLKSF